VGVAQRATPTTTVKIRRAMRTPSVEHRNYCRPVTTSVPL